MQQTVFIYSPHHFEDQMNREIPDIMPWIK